MEKKKVVLTETEAWNGEWECPVCGERYISAYYGGIRTEPVYISGDVVYCECGFEGEVEVK